MKIVLLGIDGMAPKIYESLVLQGKMPNFEKISKIGVYKQMSVTSPPQSPTSWTSMATGVNPGTHGIFDFVLRDNGSYEPHLSLVKQKHGIFSRFIEPYKHDTFFDHYAREGKDSYSIRWPLTFPAKRITTCHSIPGFGTPDINGTLGVGTLITTDKLWSDRNTKTKVKIITCGNSSARFDFSGPIRRTFRGVSDVTIPASIEVQSKGAVFRLGDTELFLTPQRWSDVFVVEFKAGMGMKISCIARALVKEVSPNVTIYVTPLQIHPKHTHHSYSSPANFGGEIFDAIGPYMTLGMAEDTNALNDKCISVRNYIDLCEEIFDERKKMLFYTWNLLKDGLLGCVFDSLDRIQHMCWREHQDIIEHWYLRFDDLLGEVMERCDFDQQNDNKLLIVSDHGFGPLNYNVHLNTWLMQNRFLRLFQQTNETIPDFKSVDWNHSKVYALGLNSVYVNLKGREPQGIVAPDEKRKVLQEVEKRLLKLKDNRGRPVVNCVYYGDEIYEGPFLNSAPDLIIGYHEGYRGSSETGLGQILRGSAVQYNESAWSGDHCCASHFVPGVLFAINGNSIPEKVSVFDVRSIIEGYLTA